MLEKNTSLNSGIYQSLKEKEELKDLSYSSISINYPNHYLCIICKTFPLFEFDKDYIKSTCLCSTNKKILFTGIGDKFCLNNILSSSALGTSDNIGIICNKHKEKFKYFCKICFQNLCNNCYENHSKKHDIINFDILKKYEDNKLKSIKDTIEKQKSDGIYIEKENSDYIKICYKSKIKNDTFYKLIELIIYDYENYPNYSHFYNIENIYMLLKNMIQNEKELELYNSEKIELEIKITYINNIQGETKLFSKTFVNNNKCNAFLKINERIFDLNTKYHIDSKEKIVSIKLIIKKSILYIDLSKMFSNCYNLKSLNGISKLGRIKIINLDKMFYNCISLESVPDISEWDISEVETASLMFYNCISLKPFPDLKKWKLDEKLFMNSSLLIFCSLLDVIKNNDSYILKIIGEGSFGRVLKEIINDKEVASKYIKSKEKNEFLNLNNNCYVDLKHKNLVNLINISTFDYKIIMEYAKGGNLANIIYNNKNLSLHFKIYCLFEICEGLIFLHSKKRIHGDLKLSNILLDKEYDGGDNYPTLKLSDFGLIEIKKVVCPGNDPFFSPPELYEPNKGNRTIQSDIYSFGVLIYEIFKGESLSKYQKIDNDMRKKYFPLPDIK